MRLVVLFAFTLGCHQSVVTGEARAPSADAGSRPLDAGVDAGLPDAGAPDEGVPPVDAGPSCPGEPRVILATVSEPVRASEIFLVFNQCMRADRGTVRLGPGGIELRAGSPDTRMRGAADLGDEFIDTFIGREAFMARPECYRRLAFSLTPPVLLLADTDYVGTVEADWETCDGRAYDPERDPGSRFTFGGP
ncbi:MAG: hypothetical protein AAGH15_16240 [Myxococcota bacterium]